MTIAVQYIIQQAQIQLSDLAGVRWPATDLVAYLNETQLEIAVARPDKFTVTTQLALVAGAKQALPDECIDLIEIPRNTSGGAIRQTEKNLLDAFNPDWYTMTGSKTVKNVAYDIREPKAFWCYPPAATGASVEVVHTTIPADVPAATGRPYTTASGNVTVPDLFKTALIHGVLYRAYAKDADVGNMNLSSAHKTMYEAAVGAQLQPQAAVKPTVTDPKQ